ncbi:PHB depolymerase family esterase [Belnapia sp. T6]|uniref:PHB depolymerase family esterase n=1 Tax=Belnapia mucosa TaxID=2804532 RepID=A0ABS1V5F9_9PROT|nr:PHB depolymerase family esterase [Belnapia mucosa]MBL6456487.1 PHB depolymerase family esterase [Belnapia mucosa]
MNQIRSNLSDLVRRQRARMATGPSAEEAGLIELAGFGANPGALRMLAFLPDDLPHHAPLVVALHGCTQDAAGFARGTGWTALARTGGFALLLPEQQQANNPNRCFNWFEPGDNTRGRGEVASIHAAIQHMVATRGIDPKRVFVTGLSAGGAMAASLLATYPEVFAAGAIIAGLPHGAATSMPEAFEAMSTGRPRPAADWAALVRSASPHRGSWPRVSIWQGDADTTVRPANAEQLVRQWATLHGVTGAPAESGSGAHRAHAWRDAKGEVVLEHHRIAGMAHGVPLDAGGIGQAGAYFLSVGIGSTAAIAGFFGLPAPQPGATIDPEGRQVPPRGATIDPEGRPVPPQEEEAPFTLGGIELGKIDPSGVIRKALTAAGLIKS